ncbi:MAG: PspC domain-containing protein [Ignavibacteria bacterium]|jgi:phage shock protein PspC (stress-responsive transcriptional regulator)|nr:PspC domain-containing protein [Ignavibacteria bacterium]HEX2963106.1 PspC domain-containing protein [Ignavibacteriales bacterium]MCU7498318.1 PspC domain-containing protein [Ignavibacteria bacterium]MCU7512671.1 PspC domain-containing protein [Ignavibacteria bacterium]MCU7520212.1 PspC domain-containing protein [Ignavibacteria bacterium]
MRERLYRSQKDKMIAGVCGGLAEYFDVDPVIIRIAFVAATILSGMGLIVYILLWIIVPYKESVAAAAAGSGSAAYAAPAGSETASEGAQGTSEAEAPYTSYRERRRNRPILGYILVGLGLLFFADRFFPYFEFHDFWPLILVAIGIGLLLRSSKK